MAEGGSVTYALIMDAVRRERYWLSGDGRIGERDAERILGWSEGSLAMKRQAGNGPAYFRLGGGRHQVTYRVADLARWIDAHQVEPV